MNVALPAPTIAPGAGRSADLAVQYGQSEAIFIPPYQRVKAMPGIT